jgi:hypothetical protein
MRRRLPPFGRELARRRDRGDHPPRVWVIVGDDWGRRPPDGPSLCVPASYQPKSYDWSVLAGLPVHLVRRGEASFGWVAGEIAVHAAPVVAHWEAGLDEWPYAPGAHAQEDVADMAFALRRPVDGRWTWPVWWSDVLDGDYQRRRQRYLRALALDLMETCAA